MIHNPIQKMLQEIDEENSRRLIKSFTPEELQDKCKCSHNRRYHDGINGACRYERYCHCKGYIKRVAKVKKANDNI